MFTVGESVYKDCESPEDYGGIALACPFKRWPSVPRDFWCRPCLLAKIRSLEMELRGIENRAHDAGNQK